MLALSITALVVFALFGGWWLDMNESRKEIRIHSLRRRREAQEEMYRG